MKCAKLILFSLVLVLTELLIIPQIPAQAAQGKASDKSNVSVTLRYTSSPPKAKEVKPIYPADNLSRGIEGEFVMLVTVRDGMLVYSALADPSPRDNSISKKCSLLQVTGYRCHQGNKSRVYKGSLSPSDMLFLDSIQTALKLWMFNKGSNADFDLIVEFTIN